MIKVDQQRSCERGFCDRARSAYMIDGGRASDSAAERAERENMSKVKNLKPSEKKAKLTIPDNFWFMIEDGSKESPLMFTMTSAYEYIMDHEFSPSAVIYWGVLQPSKAPCHKSQKDFVSRGGMFLFDFIDVCAYG